MVRSKLSYTGPSMDTRIDIAESTALQNIQYEDVIVPCRRAKNRCKCCNGFYEWLFCWADPYESSRAQTYWAVYAIIALLVDIGSDIYVAHEHYTDGHWDWAVLTGLFTALPIVFALGYMVILRQFQHWYQVHPVGPFYWPVKIINANRKQYRYLPVRTGDDATSYLHYTHEVIRCDYRSRYASAEETYLESFPESVLQAYFIIRLWTHSMGPDDHSTVTWGMLVSVVWSAISLVSFESTVAYNRPFIGTAFEPSICEIYVRFALDLLCVIPRMAAIGFFLTFEPNLIAAPCFIGLHIGLVYLYMIATECRTSKSEQAEEADFPFEQYRGYKKHRSPVVNYLRTAVVTFLFPPVCFWQVRDLFDADETGSQRGGRRPSKWREIRKSMPRLFVAISVYQFVESLGLFGVWWFCARGITTDWQEIAVPSVSLICLFVRPILDVLCQMFLLMPIAQDEAANCVRFKGTVAKTRILEVGSDIMNSLAAELLPRLQDIQQLAQEPFTEKSRSAIRKECDFIVTNFTPENIVRPHGKHRTHVKVLEPAKMTPSPGPKSEALLHEVARPDMEYLERVRAAAEQWQSSSVIVDECARQVAVLIAQCRERIATWEEIFVLCLNNQPLPAGFCHLHEKVSSDCDSIYGEYSAMIAANKKAIAAKPDRANA